MTRILNIVRRRRAGAGGPGGADSAKGADRGVVTLVRTLLLFESVMYSALTPVLPHYAHVLHASKPAVGVLTAAYPAGIVPASLIGAWIASRVGVRRTTLIGLGLFAASIAGFGFGTQIAALDLMRFAQGAGCGLIWGGGLTWVIAVAPRERRGAMLGSVFAAAIFGTLLGPIVGTLAVTLGTGPVFSVVGAISLALAGWTLRHREPDAATAASPSEGARRVLRRLTGRPIVLGSWLILLEAATLGATSALMPLRLAHLGGSSILIGATFLVASLVSTQIAGPIGRVVDRRGARAPLYAGLTASAALLAVLTLPRSPVLLAIVCVIVLGGPLTAFTIPAMTMITNAAEEVGIPLVVATMLLNLAWAVGETAGAPAAASISQATSDAVPLLMLSALMVITLRPVLAVRSRAASATTLAARTP